MRHLVDCFEAVTRAVPDRTLIVVPSAEQAFTALDLWRAHLAYARVFRESGLRGGDLLLCRLGNRPEFVPILLACRALDVTFMPLDAEVTGDEIQGLCERFGAKACVTLAEHMLPGLHHGLAPGDLALTLLQCEATCYAGAAMLKLTSGTTDAARATWTTDAQLVADGCQIGVAMRIRPDQTQLAAIPLAHSYALGVILMPLMLRGTPMVLREAFFPQQLVPDVTQFGVRRFPGVPFMFEYLLDHLSAQQWPPGLRHLLSAGAPLSPATAQAFRERFGLKIHPLYGTTETGGITFDEGDEIGDAVSVGRPLPGVSIGLSPMSDLPEGCGRVFVQSDAVSSGYVGTNAEEFSKGRFLTGDYGRLGSDGRLTLHGRISSFINVAGRKVQPEEVEAVLRMMPGIADVRVVGRVDARRGQQVVACLVAEAGSRAPTALEMRRFCATRLAPHKIPRAMLLLESIPVTSRGKTDRNALHERVRELFEDR